MADKAERRQRVPARSLYADVLVELTQLTFRNLLPTVVLSGVSLVGITMLLAHRYADRWLWLIAGVMLLLAVVRSGLVGLFMLRSETALTLRHAFRWQVLYGAATFVYACSIAVSTVYNFKAHDVTAWLLASIGVLTFCGALSGRIGVYPRLLQATGVLLLGSLAAGLLISQQPLGVVGALLLGFFGIIFYHAVDDRFEVIVEQLRSRRSLRQLAEHDTLTGCANRRHFEERLAALCHSEAPLAILFIDLDQFKSVNDSFGHAVGDILLQRVAVRLKASVRRGDLVARIGGDEFAILQSHGASQISAESLARRINRAIAAPFEIDGHELLIGTSIGIRLSTPTDKDPTALLNKADQALYRAKEAGGGRFATHNADPAA